MCVYECVSMCLCQRYKEMCVRRTLCVCGMYVLCTCEVHVCVCVYVCMCVWVCVLIIRDMNIDIPLCRCNTRYNVHCKYIELGNIYKSRKLIGSLFEK